MKRWKYLAYIVTAALTITLLCQQESLLVYGSAQTENTAEEQEYAADEILVVLEDGGEAELEAVLEEESASEEPETQIEGEDDTMQFAVVELPEDTDVEEAVEYYSQLPGVAYAQPNYIYEIEDDETLLNQETTNDPQYANQWYLDTLNVETAWQYMSSVSQSKVRVAVIDTGIDLSHPDLAANVNSEYCVSSVTDELKKITNDVSSVGHGTHVAGTIGAVTGNGKGIAGLSNNYTEIAAIQCSDGTYIYTAYVVRAISYAISIDADIINMSLGMDTSDEALEDALQTAYNKGILVVCSAGNDGTDEAHYPSSYSSTIGVIATKKDGSKRSDSSYGTDNFISAPGDHIMSTLPGSTYGYLGGSSMAAAVVTGVAADVLSVNPVLTVEQLKSILAETATDTYSTGFDAYSGWGVIAADEAVAKAAGIDTQQFALTQWDDPDSVESFVRRLYAYCLSREADETGLADWMNRLVSGKENGGEVAAGFLFSREFLAKNVSDEEYVNILYKVFLGRTPDSDGKAYWLSKLENGMSRTYVMNGFSASTEFTAICKNCGFQSGTVACTQMRDQNEGVTAFVARLYRKALGRTYDEDGLNDWCGRILNNSWTPYRVATEGFLHSDEFESKNTSDTEFVKILYRTFLDREYDADGLQYWLAQLQNGKTRDQVVAGFAYSDEFNNLMAKYGL